MTRYIIPVRVTNTEGKTMDKSFIVELTLHPVAIVDADDTAGYSLQQGGSSSTVAFHVTLPALVRAFNPQPDPPLPPFDRTVEDVVAFRFMEEMTNTNEGQGGPSNPGGDLTAIGKAIGDAFSWFGGTMQNPAILAAMQDLKTYGL